MKLANSSISTGGIQYLLQCDFDKLARSILTNFKTEKAPSNKTPALTKSTNIGIWIVSTSNQLFIRGS